MRTSTSEKSQGSLESQPTLFPHLRGQVSCSQADQALALAASTQHACACVYGQGPPAGALVTQYPTPLCSGAIAGNPLGVDRELLRAGEAPCPSFPGRQPSASARSHRHTPREGRGLGETLVVSVDLRLERPGEAMPGECGTRETQDSRLPPGACTRLPQLLPLPTLPPWEGVQGEVAGQPGSGKGEGPSQPSSPALLPSLSHLAQNWTLRPSLSTAWMPPVSETLWVSPGSQAGDVGSIPRLGRLPGGGNGNPLQYSYLGDPMDRGAFWAAVHASCHPRMAHLEPLQAG